MSSKNYDHGKLNLPFVGPVTFAKAPLCLDISNLTADVAVLGVPNDMGTQYRSGCRFGPRAIREATTLFSFGHAGLYSYEEDRLYLTEDQVTFQDVGDVDIIHTDMATSHSNTTAAVRAILQAGAMPLVLGGDHSITAPCIAAFEGRPIHVVHIDAHLDFVDERCGVRYGHGNPLRRASEMEHVRGITQLGIRNVSSSNAQDHKDAKAAGSDIISVRQFRDMGVHTVLERIPDNVNYYVTMDIDGLDPSIAPGTGTPSCGGFNYYEVLDIYKGLARKGQVLGMDLVEVSPPYDPSGVTAIHAAQILMTAVGYIFYERAERKKNR